MLKYFQLLKNYFYGEILKRLGCEKSIALSVRSIKNLPKMSYMCAKHYLFLVIVINVKMKMKNI